MYRPGKALALIDVSILINQAVCRCGDGQASRLRPQGIFRGTHFSSVTSRTAENVALFNIYVQYLYALDKPRTIQ